MIGFGILAGIIAALIAVQWRRGRITQSRWLTRLGVWVVALPLLANSAGWLFTETARQPWLVYGLLRTQDGASPNVSNGFVLATLVGFTALYGVLGLICFRITRRIAMAGPDAPLTAGQADASGSETIALV